jgi:hypothetical protein
MKPHGDAGKSRSGAAIRVGQRAFALGAARPWRLAIARHAAAATAEISHDLVPRTALGSASYSTAHGPACKW